MESINLEKKLGNLVTSFEKELSSFIVDGDVPPDMRNRLEFLQDKIAETYLMATNSAPVIKVTRPIIPEIAHGRQPHTN